MLDTQSFLKIHCVYYASIDIRLNKKNFRSHKLLNLENHIQENNVSNEEIFLQH